MSFRNNTRIQTPLIQLFVKTFVFPITTEKDNNGVAVSLSCEGVITL